MATGRSSARHCCVPLCVSDDRYSETISFHRFPKDESLRKQWIVKIRRDEGPLFQVKIIPLIKCVLFILYLI